MVKLAGPAMSLDASGTLGDSITFSKWKGRPYARVRVTPHNPKSAGQMGVRAMFMFLTKQWAGLSAGNKASWEIRAAATNISPFNAFIAYNQFRWRNYLSPSKVDPAAEVATAPTAPTITATAGVRQITIAITKGANPADWGWMVFRGATGFTPTWSNCIAVIQKDGSGNGSYINTPLAAGTYYYKVVGIMIDGIKGSASTEANATVT